MIQQEHQTLSNDNTTNTTESSNSSTKSIAMGGNLLAEPGVISHAVTEGSHGARSGVNKTMMPSRLMTIAKKATISTTTDTVSAPPSSNPTSPISIAASSPTTAQASNIPISPTRIGATARSEKNDTVSASTAATTTIHKKDSGISIASSVTADTSKGSNVNRSAMNPTLPGSTPTPPRKASQPDTAAKSTLSPAGRVLTPPLSTSKLSSAPLATPYILPNQQHYTRFNLAALGQLSPSASTANMTMLRSDSLALLNSSGSTHNPYFGTVSGSLAPRSHISSAVADPAGSGGGGGIHSDGVILPSGSRTMCGSDAISLLDLEDSNDDLVMIDSNGNSSGSGVIGAATVGATIASASAIVSNNQPHHHHHHPAGLTLATSSTGSASNGAGPHHPGNASASSNLSQRSSLPSLNSAMQRAAMIAAVQQNGGAKILTGQRVGRRQDRPSRGIRFGEFHRICEIEYGFDEGTPLIANGRALIHSACVLRIENDKKREEMLYLFSDVLVTGTRKEARPPVRVQDFAKESILATEKKQQQADVQDIESVEIEIENKSDILDTRTAATDLGTEAKDGTPAQETVLNNPYAGHLENQRISRLIQVQADVVEGDERPVLMVTAPQMSSLLLFGSIAARDSFLTLLNETIVAHKHHLLFQSKYLADLKKFKRHSAFSFDTSFLKTWGIPGGLTLGSIKPVGNGQSSGHGTIGPGTFIASPLTSPGGGAFDPYQHQQHLNRPQSTAGNFFSFALHGGSFPSFSDHSKDNSYATLRGANAANALQYHQQQQQRQNRLSMASTTSRRPGIDRTPSGSTFDALWFMKGGETVKRRKSVVESSISTMNQEDKEKQVHEDECPDGESATSSLHSSSSTSNPIALGNTNQHTASRLSSLSFSTLPASSNQNSVEKLRNGAEWVRDEDATVCMVCCSTKFNVLVRKHHCRLCGRVICWRCCQMKDAVIMSGATDSSEPGAVSSQEVRKPIRVCLDCIEQDASLTANQQHPPPQSSLFPLQGVLGKLINSTTSSPQLMTSVTNATGSTFTRSQGKHAQISFQQHSDNASSNGSTSFYPHQISHTRSGRPYPHHHRASFYRIDVERVGEEDEEEDEEDEGRQHEEKRQQGGQGDEPSNGPISDAVQENPEPELQHFDAPSSPLTTILKSNRASLRLEDPDPIDINEDEVNSQIMTLESEVESLFIQNSPLLFAGNGNSTSGSVGKTRVLRRMPKDLFQSGELAVSDGEKEEESGEEKTMEELLAQQDEQFKHLLT
ncbi:Zinc finger FYVE domain-containing protein 26 [Haplosporangium sp. Z 11]|nr:Zinc finger FYVE domain-containing protein 26 [Haplosporangium sp. Z 11]